MKKYVLAATALILIFSLFSGCSALSDYAASIKTSAPTASITPAPSPMPIATPIPSPALSPSPTASLAPSATPEATSEVSPLSFIDFENMTPELEEAINQKFQEFLNTEGKFDSYELSKTGFFDNYPRDDGSAKEFYLGTLHVSQGIDNYPAGYFIEIQGVLLTSVLIEDRFFLICGFENKEKERFLSPVEIPINIILNENDKMSFVLLVSPSRVFGLYSNISIKTKKIEEIIDACNEYIDRPVVFTARAVKIDPNDPKMVSKVYVEAGNERVDIARNFAASLYIPKLFRSDLLKYLKKSGKISGKRLIILSEIKDLDKVNFDKTILDSGFYVVEK